MRQSREKFDAYADAYKFYKGRRVCYMLQALINLHISLTNVHLFGLARGASSFFGQFCCHAARSLWTSKPFSTQVYKGEAGECCYRSSPVVAWALV